MARRWTSWSALTLSLVLALSALGVASGAPALAQAEPVFHLPFACGEIWHASTRDGHGALGGNGYYAVDWNHYDEKGNQDDHGRQVLAGADGGTVVEVDRAIADANGDGVLDRSDYGNYVIVRYGEGEHAVELLFAHLETVGVSEDAGPGSIMADTVIGTVGADGIRGTDGRNSSSAYHLHYEQRVDGKPRQLVIEGRTLSIGEATEKVDITNDHDNLAKYPAKRHKSKNCGTTSGVSVPDVTQDPVPDVVTRHAPLVYLHPDEPYWPYPADAYLQRATEYETDDGTRYLDIPDEYHHGAPLGQAPVYFEYVPGESITYWFFYAFDEQRLDDASSARPKAHEGDWERIVVRLDANDEPTGIAYHQHECAPLEYAWHELSGHEPFGSWTGFWDGTHPIVYSALGSHASYPGPRRRADPVINDCREIRAELRQQLESAIPGEVDDRLLDVLDGRATDTLTSLLTNAIPRAIRDALGLFEEVLESYRWDAAQKGPAWKTWAGAGLVDATTQAWYGDDVLWGAPRADLLSLDPDDSLLRRVAGGGVGPGGGNSSTCSADPRLLDAQAVADAFPDVAGDAPVFMHVLPHDSEDVRRFADLMAIPYEDLPFLVRAWSRMEAFTSRVEAFALRVPGACPDDLLEALSHSFSTSSSSNGEPVAWTPIWSSTLVGSHDAFAAAVPDELAPGWVVYALIRGDVMFFAVDDTSKDVEDLFSGLRFASDGDSATPHRWLCQSPADGTANQGDASPVADVVDAQGNLRGTYQVVATDVQDVTPEILEQTCMIVANRLNAAGADVLQVRVVSPDLVQVVLGPISDETPTRRLIGTTGVLEFTPVPDGCSDDVVPAAPSPDCLAETEPLFNGSEIASASVGQDAQTGQLAIDLELKDTGARILDEYAEQNLHGRYAIVLDDIVELAPRIDTTHFGAQVQITGDFSVSEAENLVIVLRFGSLPLEIREVGFQELDATAASSASDTTRLSGTGSMSTGDVGGAALLADGRVAVLHDHSVWGDNPAYDEVSVELYDSAGSGFSPGGRLRIPRGGASVTALADGRLLVAGGSRVWFPLDVVSAAELYDPATGRSRRAGHMTVPRSQAASVRLLDGKVLIAGGTDGSLLEGTCCETLSSAELYDPNSGLFTPTGSMLEPRERDHAFVLPDGRVLLVGGEVWVPQGSRILTSTEIYDPVSGWFESGPSLPMQLDDPAITQLDDGRILVAGGGRYVDTGESVAAGGGTLLSEYPSAQAWLLDSEAGRWEEVGELQQARWDAAAASLPGGRALIVGGIDHDGDGPALGTVEVFDSESGEFTTAGHMDSARTGSIAIALQDGSVLIAGGIPVYPGKELDSAELFR